MSRKKASKSQNTHDLFQSIIEAKDRKKIFLRQLKKNVNKSQIMIKKSQSEANLPSRPSQPVRILNKKQKSLDQLVYSLNDRIKIDRIASTKLQSMTQEQIEKKLQLEKRIQQIKRRNQFRAKELEEFESKYLKRLNEDYQKDKQKQQKLLLQYQSVMSNEGKIKETQSYRKAIQTEDWRAIIKQKQKLEKMIRQFRKKQEMLIKDQSPESLKKIAEANQLKVIVEEKTEVVQIKRQKVKVDAKEIGNQYLQYAKKLKEMPKQKPKIRMLDVNFKCIDYGGDIMNKIARNTGDLSKIRMQPALITVKQTKLNKEGSFKSLPSPPPQIKEDEETKKYLKQIRNNLKQIEKSS